MKFKLVFKSCCYIRRRPRRGGGIAYFVIIVGILSIVLMSLIFFVLSQVNFSLHSVRRAEALNIAEAGINFYRWYLAHQTDGKSAAQIVDFWTNGSPYGVAAPFEQDYDNRGRYRITVTPPSPGETAVTVESVGWTYNSPDVRRTVRVRLRRPSWSEYSVLANADIRFGSGTETFGPLHSNGGIRFDGVAHNTVKSARETYVDPDTGLTRPGVWTAWSGEYNTSMGSEVFLGGKDFPVSTVDFNSVSADIAALRNEAQSNGLYFDSSGYGRHLILRPDDTVEVRTVTAYNTSSNGIISETVDGVYNIPDGSVIYVENNIWVEGRINTLRITIVSADHTGGSTPNIYIGSDILYTSYDGSDIIGLIAAGNIEIIRDSEDDLRIDAALLAQNGRVGRSYYGWYCTRWATWQGQTWCTNWERDVKTTITVYGSIATNRRYGFAWSDGTGYVNRNLIYDNTFLYTPPPFFPAGDRYIADLWEEL